MHTMNLKSLIQSAVTVSPDRRHSLAWSWGGTIGIFSLKHGEPELTFREEHGAILRAGFSPDMRELIAENEDLSFSVWYTAHEVNGVRCTDTGNIVDFMLNNECVPCLNVTPGPKAYRFAISVHDFSESQYNCFDWGRDYCARCAWHRRVRLLPGRVTPDEECTCSGGCEFKLKRARSERC